MGEVMIAIQDGDKEEVAAQNWIDANRRQSSRMDRWC